MTAARKWVTSLGQRLGFQKSAGSSSGRPAPARDMDGRELVGPWELDTHWPRPMPPLSRDAWTQDFPRGLQEACQRYGLLLDTLEYRRVEGFLYKQPQMVGAPKGGGGSKLPPKFVFQLLFALHPAITARRRIARTLFATRPWREDAQRWQEQVKPELIQAHRALLRAKLPELSDTALFEHITQCGDQLRRSTFYHGRYLAAAMVPVADFMIHASEWTGLQLAQLMRLLGGFSPTTANRLPQTQALVKALQGSPQAVQLLSQPDAPLEVLERLMEHPEVGSAARDYLDFVGYRLTGGYDIGAPFAFEYPQLLVVGIRAALEAAPSPDTSAQLREEVRGKVPGKHQALFDELLEEARRVYPLRDERILYGDSWSSGVVRRALLHAGERLMKRDRVEAADHALGLELDELRALLRGDTGPSREELAERARGRQRSSSEVPAFYGPVPPPPPPFDWIPEDMRRSVVATQVAMSEVDQTVSPGGAEVIRGVGVSSGRYTGRVRHVKGPEELHLVRAGEVLVAGSTSPAYNVVLPLVGAVVTDVGGVLSHAAIITREYGIPGVVGTRDGSRRLQDGEQVTVDGDTGEVRKVA